MCFDWKSEAVVKCVCGRGTDVKDEECVGDSDEEKKLEKRGKRICLYAESDISLCCKTGV